MSVAVCLLLEFIGIDFLFCIGRLPSSRYGDGSTGPSKGYEVVSNTALLNMLNLEKQV